MHANEDTITAIATPMGRAGIGIIRLSGPMALPIALKLFKPKGPEKKIQSHRLYLGSVHDPSTGSPIDEVLLSFMRKPRSYTREDVIEINCHSGHAVLSRILRIVLQEGARLALPGEFTLRAFLNGRIDLTQAEAVIDLINSKSEKGLELASKQIQGSLRQKIESLRQKAVDMLAQVEVGIDFPDEDANTLSIADLAKRLDKELIKPLEGLIEEQSGKRIWVDGIKTVIAGRANVGKSSILNRLLNEEKAIVTPVPGTTRDVIETTISIHGIPLCLMDTAGLRQGEDEVEKIGIHLTEKKLAEAELLLAVIDNNIPLNHEDLRLINQCREKGGVVVINKTDLPSRICSGPEEKDNFSRVTLVRVSALTGQGLDELKAAIVESILGGESDLTDCEAAVNPRHGQALKEALRSFRKASKGLREKAPLEIVAFELNNGLTALGDITGVSFVSDETLDTIFSSFCLGK